MNWNDLKDEGLAIVGELAKNDNLAPADKLEALKADVKPLIDTSLDGIVETLPAGIQQAVQAVMSHGGKDFVMMFLVPLLAEELYQIWKLLHMGQQQNPPKITQADKV